MFEHFRQRFKISAFPGESSQGVAADQLTNLLGEDVHTSLAGIVSPAIHGCHPFPPRG